MFIGYFTERPYQDPQSGYFGATGKPIMDLRISNGEYDAKLGADLYNRYLDEKVYAEEMGFDVLMLNEHHSTPFCMGGAMNVEASILARITRRAKIVLLGNIIPIWDDPLWLVEQLAMIDLISRGRLVSGWVRGTGRESVAHNAPPHYNWERFQEGNEGTFNPALATLPGLTSRTRVLPTQVVATRARGGAAGVLGRPYEQQIADYTIISGTPKTVLPKIRHVLEYVRPGSIFFWDGDGAMTHDDAMRSLRLMGEEVIPAIRDMAQELELPGPFEVDPATGQRIEDNPARARLVESDSSNEA